MSATDLNEEQFKDLIDESSQLGRASEAIDEDLFMALALSPAAAVDASPPDKRAAARIGVRYAATARPIIPEIDEPATPFRVTVVDVSRDGVGIVCPVEIHVKFQLEMPARDGGGATFAVMCTRRSLRALGGGKFHVGATFDHPLDDPRWARPPKTVGEALRDMLPKHESLLPFDIRGEE